MGVLATLALVCAGLSLLAVGGANALVPEFQRVAAAYGWASADTFAGLFALAQAAPGPNMLIVTLLGLRAAGLAGAVVATVAFVAPAALLAVAVLRAPLPLVLLALAPAGMLLARKGL